MAKKKTEPVAHFFGGVDPAGTGDDVDFSLDSADETETETEDLASLEGEIAIDVRETPSEVVIVSPIAGVDPEDIEIAANEDEVTISGERQSRFSQGDGTVHAEEIYWGSFSRTVRLPVPCHVEKAAASCKHGILTVRIPKTSVAKKRTIKVHSAE